MKKLLIIAIAGTTLLVSCKKAKNSAATATKLSSSAINVPAGFTWQNSRNLNFTVNVINALAPAKIHVISIYGGDPDAGGVLLAKGSAVAIAAFKAKIYLSNTITSVYIICDFPDGTKRLQKLAVGTADVTTTIGS
jgi:hypothetical protein